MYRNRTATQKNFATVPRADIPRSKLRLKQTRKQAFNASELIPIMCEEVLPGDTWQHSESIMARLATPIAPAIDDIDLETFYFFVPNRIVWEDWEDFISGTNTNISGPRIFPAQGLTDAIVQPNSVFDHFGIPPGDYTAQIPINGLPIYAYFMIYNEWFRDQNLQNQWNYAPNQYSYDITRADSPVTVWNQMPLRVNKRHDYFTSSLPWPQKGNPVRIPLGLTAPVVSNAVPPQFDGIGDFGFTLNINGSNTAINKSGGAASIAGPISFAAMGPTGLIADLSNATAATINSLRLAFQTQKLLERDARGGSRYVEQILAHFGVRSPDYRLQRPEYLGGSKIPVTVNPIAQTAAYDAEPGDTNSPVGNLGAEMHASGSRRSFTYAATEHGYIIGLACVRATPTYQQGIRRHWIGRSTRLNYYFPAFAMLGEQAVETREIYTPLNNAPANATWGFQERWAEYRYTPNEITGVLRSTAAQPMDWWHYAEEFSGEPALNGSFITDKTQETLARSLATAPSAQWSAQIIMDVLHNSTVARLMPTYSVPGLIDHF